MNIAFIMDPLEGINKKKDTSYILMVAALERGHRVFHIDQNDLEIREGAVVYSQVTEVKNPFQAQKKVEMSLSEMQYIWVRKDPPFDRRYFYTTLILDYLPSSTKVLNRPQSLRDWNEKLCALRYGKWVPETLISQDVESILQFVQRQESVIIKPIDGFGGKGIIKVQKDDPELKKKVLQSTQNASHKVVVNEFIQEAELGDKRILLVNGEPIGAILRVAEVKGGLNNLDQGGRAQRVELSDFDQQLCREMKADLLDAGLFFVGIDLLGEKLTEINVTSPTGLQELIQFSKTPHHLHIIELLESGI